MMHERRIFGPPGTGKTTHLATREIPKAVDEYGHSGVMVTSFTRAGAREISVKPSRDTGKVISVDERNVGTLHSIIFNELQSPPLIEVNFVDEWNRQYPTYRISGKKVTSMDDAPDEEFSGGYEGDTFLNAMNIYRHRMVSESKWDPMVTYFAKIWNDYKKNVMAMDFTELIEHALRHMPYAPNQPQILFVDEAQDFTALELSVVRSWGINMAEVVLVGDDDQCIYSFAGANPDAFLNPPIPDKDKQVLGQSYRVPLSILERSQQLIKRVKLREPKVYKPRSIFGDPEMGRVREVEGANWKTPDRIMALVREYMEKDMSVMILASCSYMLNHIRGELFDAGIPFHNPYRKRTPAWNPLRVSANSNAATNVLLSFLDKGENGYWSIPQFVQFAQFLKVGETGLIPKQGRAAIKALKQMCEDNVEGLESCDGCIDQVLSPTAIEKAMQRDIGWFVEHLHSAKQKPIQYPITVYKKVGIEALTKEPKVIIGTIHSVKGGEADAVILFPDISFKADATMETRNGHDALIRLFYVGMTRAKEELVLCGPAAGKFYNSQPRFYVKL